MNILVGYTGFVGSNLSEQFRFDALFNSRNISEAFELSPDLCVYSGVPAEKFLANNNPEADKAVCEIAVENIIRINPKRLILISTIDVFLSPVGCDEDIAINETGLHAYGKNRLYIERWCADNIEDCHIIRLPGLFGKNIRKNFIYDMIHFIPSALNEVKFLELSGMESILCIYYRKQENGFYKLRSINDEERFELIEVFKRLNFSALNFTDSRAVFQFYNLAHLWSHILLTISHNIPLIHLATEPVSAAELYYKVHGEEFINEIVDKPPFYDFRTRYAGLTGGGDGYIYDKDFIIEEINKFIMDCHAI